MGVLEFVLEEKLRVVVGVEILSFVSDQAESASRDEDDIPEDLRSTQIIQCNSRIYDGHIINF